jgi:phosphoserine phosphatase
MVQVIQPYHVTQSTRTLIQKHRAAGDYLLIITATNRFYYSAYRAKL